MHAAAEDDRLDAAGISNVVIRRLAPVDSINDLTDLLHRAYARLGSMGLRYYATHQGPEVTARRAARGECYVGVHDGRLVATITLAPPTKASGTAWYERPEVATINQFAVDPALQGRGLGSRLLALVEHRATEMGATELALDTADPARHLIDFYRRRHYRIVGRTSWELVNYESVIMSKRLSGANNAPAGIDPIIVFIENEAGSHDKHVHDETTLEHLRTVRVSRPYPLPYGFVLETRSGDGGNLDCFVLTDRRLTTGQAIPCDVVAMLEQIEDGAADHNVLAVPADDPVPALEEPVEALRDFIAHVFDHVPGKRIRTGRLLDRASALAHVSACRDPGVR